MDNKTLLITLRIQHKDLAAMLGRIKESAYMDAPDAGKIVNDLGEFKKNILAHVALEGESFYPQLLELEKAKGMDIDKTKEFIAKMGGIANQVVEFLGTYENEQMINNNINDFRKNLDHIIGILSMRIEAEEDFVFADFEMLSGE